MHWPLFYFTLQTHSLFQNLFTLYLVYFYNKGRYVPFFKTLHVKQIIFYIKG